MVEERKCCGTFEGTPHRNTCRPNMIKEIASLTTILAERDAEIKRLKGSLFASNTGSKIKNIKQSEFDQLKAQLTASQQECKRLKAEVQSLQYPSYCAREADARKQAARECVEILRFYNGVEGIADQVMKKFGLEG